MILTNKLYPQNSPIELTKEEKEITVDSICKKLQKIYVFPEVATKMADLISTNLKKGNYTSINNPTDFADELSKDLLSISHDKHIGVYYNREGITAQNAVQTAEDSLNSLNKNIAEFKRANFGFKELKIVDGNI